MGGIDGWGIGGPPTSEELQRLDQENKVNAAYVRGLTEALKIVTDARSGYSRDEYPDRFTHKALDVVARRIRAKSKGK